MGKERFIEAGRQGLKKMEKFAETKPKTVFLGVVGITGAVAGQGLTFGY